LRKYIATTAFSAVLLCALTFFTLGGTALAAPIAPSATTHNSYKYACAAVQAGYARCLALIALQKGSSKILSSSPNAGNPGGGPPYAPANLHNAYNLPNDASGTPTVAIVDAYSDPNLAKDLSTYRSEWGIPACTTSSGCLKIVNQNGGTKLPSGNVSWGVEESLDVDMVSAICQNCHILVVEANSPSNGNLGTAVNEAVKLKAVAVSNSYGENEFSGENSTCNSYYNHSYVAITVSAGDSGPGVEFPAVCPNVTSIGGTTLNSDGSETAWNTSSSEGSGGGCSAYVSKPSWENSSVTGCSRRAVSDTSAVADPNTGVYVYDSYGGYGWLEVGGTSVSSPLTAAVYALAGNATTTQYPASLPWTNYGSGCLYIVGGVQYAYQTGLGSPDGTGCF
jgi:subtilase family serine protease